MIPIYHPCKFHLCHTFYRIMRLITVELVKFQNFKSAQSKLTLPCCFAHIFAQTAATVNYNTPFKL